MPLRRRPPDLDYDDVARLVLEHLDSRESWQRAINALRWSLPALVDSAERELDDESLASLWSILIVFLSHTGLRSPERKEALFREGETVSMHVLPAYYSSPVPDTRALPEELWSRELDAGSLGIVDAVGLAFLDRCAPFAGELAGADTGYDWDNPQFNPVDAMLEYCVLRAFAPGTVVEVGSGYSTQIASLAAERNGSTTIVCVDPEPRADVLGLPSLGRLVRAPVQDVALEELTGLSAGDVLFVDSSHVVRTGSDVNRIVLEVMPRLAPGVLVHFHDVFLPWEYPRHWVVEHHHFWSEQYLLAAFLSGNVDWEVLWAGQYMGRRHADAVRRGLALEHLPDVAGTSFWLRRRPSPAAPAAA